MGNELETKQDREPLCHESLMTGDRDGKGWRGFQKESACASTSDSRQDINLVARQVPAGLLIMDPSPTYTLAEVLLNLSTELNQGAGYIR